MTHLREALVFAADETPYHLSAVELRRYAQGTMNEIDLEIAASHLETCETCSDQVRQTSARRRWIGSPFAGRWQPARIAAAVLLGVAVILVALWLLRSRPAERKDEIAWPASPSPSPVSVDNSPTPQLSPAVTDEFALVLSDGSRRVTVDQKGTLAGLERLPSRIQERVGAALRTGKLEQSTALAQLASEPSTLLGNSNDGMPFRLIGPLGQIVRNQQPTLRWRALDGAESYKVIVTDAELNQVAASAPLTTTEWRVTKPLPPGGIYSWQVTAVKDGAEIISPVMPAPQAKFKVLDSATTRMLAQAERAYSDSHLTLGVLYAEAGLLEEAEQELRLLVRDNPRADIAQKLLRSVQSLRTSRARS
ncbi:MAG TPA: hypothetical protein VHH35_18850 [Pyrinomonadaceae bacterium]|nr:hypothetical protein [Pyrinomonadaceae bacterium]